MGAYDDLTKAGVSTRKAAALTGIPRSSATRKQAPTPFLGPPAKRVVANKLSPAEQVRVLAVLNSEEFMDHAPLQVYAALLERGVYLCSVSTMYRILRKHDQVRERRRLARHPARKVPELVATGPGQVYTWDITKLPGPAKGIYYDAYVMIDIFSRYIVGAYVHPREAGPLAEEMMKEIFAHPRDPASGARRPRHRHDVKIGRSTPGRPPGHPVTLAPEGVQRQPLL